MAIKQQAEADPATRLAIALQNVVRGKKSRENTEHDQLVELFVMPPRTADGGDAIESLLGDDGCLRTTLTLGHDSDRATGDWEITLDVREPAIIHHVTFDVGNDPTRPLRFKSDYTHPYSARMPSGALQDSDYLQVLGHKATRVVKQGGGAVGPGGEPLFRPASARGGKPAEPIKRLDASFYASPQRVRLQGVKGRAGELIDLRTMAEPPCDARLANPRRSSGPAPPGSHIKARVVVHFHKYFDAPPLLLEHTIRLDGRGGASQHPVVLFDPDTPGNRPRRPKGARAPQRPTSGWSAPRSASSARGSTAPTGASSSSPPRAPPAARALGGGPPGARARRARPRDGGGAAARRARARPRVVGRAAPRADAERRRAAPGARGGRQPRPECVRRRGGARAAAGV